MVTLVLPFRTSAGLASRSAVVGPLTITTLLFFYIVRHQWGYRQLWVVAIGAGGLLSVDLLFLAANLTKLVHGAWLPLLIAIVTFTVLTTWQRGRELVTRRRGGVAARVRRRAARARSAAPGGARPAVFLNRGKATAPLAMRANVEHNHILHEHVVILSIETVLVPHVPPAERLVIDDLARRPPRSCTWRPVSAGLRTPPTPLPPRARPGGGNRDSARRR